ncbi:DUF4136 domain-containing protein [Andreprevotia chitinilytica]|uniref:DUF4136 domain-containing protein n=1 Tax=Andreprevotia chitinilytica TaxID=396808 RepID=UPI00054FF53D|nr:DUF4136 domain-containing protein [Andreprevotia chitinilytica]
MKQMLLGGLCALALLAGCATAPPQFVSQVTVRNTFTSSVEGKRFAFKRDASQAQSLLQRDVEREVASNLQGAGLIEETDPKRIDWWVELAYGIDDGKTVSQSQPVWGTTGFYTYYRRISTPNGIVIMPYSYPQTGIVGSRTVSETFYTRYLSVDIYDRRALERKEFAKLYEGEAKNRSQNDQFDQALPWLARALFRDFPGVSGSRVVRQIMPLDPAQ